MPWEELLVLMLLLRVLLMLVSLLLLLLLLLPVLLLAAGIVALPDLVPVTRMKSSLLSPSLRRMTVSAASVSSLPATNPNPPPPSATVALV